MKDNLHPFLENRSAQLTAVIQMAFVYTDKIATWKPQ